MAVAVPWILPISEASYFHQCSEPCFLHYMLVLSKDASEPTAELNSKLVSLSLMVASHLFLNLTKASGTVLGPWLEGPSSSLQNLLDILFRWFRTQCKVGMSGGRVTFFFSDHPVFPEWAGFRLTTEGSPCRLG